MSSTILSTKKLSIAQRELLLNAKLNIVEYDADKTGMEIEKLGVGEVVINSIDNDGMMKGYDLKLVEIIREVINLPLTVLGGAGTIQDIKQLINKHKIIGAAAGSLFVFKGKYKAVLINYPTRDEIKEINGQE